MIRLPFSSYITAICFFASLGMLNASCTSNSSSTTSASTSTGTLSSLPKATGPVTGASSASDGVLAVTGLQLKAWGKASRWTAGSSRAMCETGLLVRDALSQAMSPDKVACYLGAIQSTGGFASDIATGNYVYVKLVNLPGNAGSEPHIKMRITKTDGAISSFEMFSCFEGTGTTQSEYFIQSISGGVASMTTKNVGSGGGATYGSKTTVSGTLNSSYAWTSKSLTVERIWNGGTNGSFSQKASITQRPTSLIVNGYQTGTQGAGASRNIFTNKFYTVIQALSTTTPKAMALADGSGKYDMNWCVDANQDSSCTGEATSWTGASTDSWNGDTLARLGTASSGTYYTEANAGSLVSTTPTVSVSFDTAEQWNCTLPAEILTVDLSNMQNTATAIGAAFAACDEQLSYQNESDATGGYPCQDAR